MGFCIIMPNKTHITVLPWQRAVKLSPSSGGWRMARTVWNGILAERCQQDHLLGAIKNSGFTKGPDEPRVLNPSPLSLSPGTQILRRLQAIRNLVWGQATWPGGDSCSLNSEGFLLPAEASKLKPQGQTLKPHWVHTNRHSGFFLILVDLKCQFAG